MARARNIKPGFFKNPELAELSFEFRLLFIGLWCLADREGRLEDRPKRIRMEVFPADDVNVEDGLQALAGLSLIVRYEAEGNAYIWIPAFLEHQHPHPREVASVIPPCPGQAKALASPSDVLNPESSPSESGTPPPNPVVLLPLNGKDGDFAVTAADLQNWRDAYPAVEVEGELRRMREWLISNPKRRKTRTGIRNFVTTWLSKEQNRGRNVIPLKPADDFRGVV